MAHSAGTGEQADCISEEGYYLPTPPLGQDMTQGQFF